MSKAVILFLTYGRFQYTKESLTSIIDNTDRNLYDLLVWDNGTRSDEMLNWLEQTCKKNCFHFVFYKINVGLTTAMNNQMRIMNKLRNYDIFCHVANDIVVPKNWLSQILKASNNKYVGLVGLNLENRNFVTRKIEGMELEVLENECNVGGMHFCIPKKTYDLLGGFQHVKYGYGQQDANYSLKVKLLPNDWWIYYLPKEKYKGVHLQKQKPNFFKKYHFDMSQILKLSANDQTGGKKFREYLTETKKMYDKKQLSFKQLINKYKVPEKLYSKVYNKKVIKTSLKDGIE